MAAAAEAARGAVGDMRRLLAVLRPVPDGTLAADAAADWPAVGAPGLGRARRWAEAHPQRVSGLVIAGYWLMAAVDSLTAVDQAGAAVRLESGTAGAALGVLRPLVDLPARLGPSVEPAWLAAAAVIGSAALWRWRWRAPWRLLVVGGVVGAVGWLFVYPVVWNNAMELYLGCAALFAVSRWVGPRECVRAGVVLLAASGLLQCVLARDLFLGGPVPPAPGGDAVAHDLPELLLCALVVVVWLGLCVNWASLRRQAAAAVEVAELMAVERDQRARLAVAAERTRLARELHDVVSHSLAVIVSLADGAVAVAAKAPDKAEKAMGQVAETARSAVGEMRRMLDVLAAGEGGGPAGELELAPQPGELDVWRLVETFRAVELPVTLHVDGPLPQEPVVALTVYRVVQEALTNALRHARGATRVEARVVASPDEVVIDVVDDGHGDGRSAGSGQGLVGMGQRAAAFGGVVEAGPGVGGGWRVHVELRPGAPVLVGAAVA
jgi:signal transduction histidine kinase